MSTDPGSLSYSCATLTRGEGAEVVSLGDVASGVRAACGKAAQARTALEQAEDLAQEAHDVLARALEGAHRLEADRAQVLAIFTRVVDACKSYLWPLLNEAVKDAESYAAHLAAESALASGSQRPAQHPAQPPTAQPQSQALPAKSSKPPVIPPERIEELRRGLPPPVVPGTGQKTHGQWTTAEGEERTLVSGYGELLEECEKAFPELGLRRGLPNIASHVETKLAAYMRNHHVRSATLVINNRPCEDGLSPVMRWCPRFCATGTH
ncbi:DddA-like double-stranded DNA deaminase toxin [Saccharothrix isguenensis]